MLAMYTLQSSSVAKGFTQTYGVDYEETFSPVADIRAIRILIAIAAFYDYEIWQIKNGYSKRGYIPMQERLDLNKTQGASTPGEVKRMQNVPYDLAVVAIAGFETDRDDTKSQTGYVFILNGGAVDWKSSKQSTTTMSATEAEYIAASEARMEVVWIRKFISGLGIVPTINEPIKMFCDNSAALHFANEPGVQRGARHYP
ncbi:retrotransposon protein, putative, ty1-copia subclass [Tanacetum coccineum]